MRQDGVQPNARFFTELIRICGRAGDMAVRPPLRPRASLNPASAAADAASFYLCFCCCCLCSTSTAVAGGGGGAAAAASLPPDAVGWAGHPRCQRHILSLSLLLHAVGQAAEVAWADAKAAGVAPDLILYSAMIDTCGKVCVCVCVFLCVCFCVCCWWCVWMDVWCEVPRAGAPLAVCSFALCLPLGGLTKGGAPTRSLRRRCAAGASACVRAGPAAPVDALAPDPRRPPCLVRSARTLRPPCASLAR